MSQQPESAPAHSRGAVDLTQINTAPTQDSAVAPGQTGPSWVMRDVDENSIQQLLPLATQVPVIIHLAAPSNPVSDQIDAVLIPAIDARAGRMVMGRVDVEARPQMLQAFGAPGGPMVLAVMGGQAIPLFNQATDETQVETLLDEINSNAVQNGMSATVPPLVEAQDETGAAVLPPLHQKAEDALAEGNFDEALQAYQQALNENPGDDEAATGISRVKLIQRTSDMDAQAVRDAAAQQPDDVQAQVDCADLDILGGHVADAFARLVRFIGSHFGDDRETAREHLVTLYDVVGAQDPRVADSRKKLAMALF